MRNSQDTSTTVLDRYDMYTGDKSDADVGSGRLVRLVCSYGFPFSVSTWNLFEIAVRDSDVCKLERTVPLTFDVHCARGFAHPTSPLLRHFSLYWVILSFGRLWVSIGVDTQPPIQWVPGTLSLGIKRPGREADHSPPFSAEVKNAWSYTSTPQYFFMTYCLLKHRDNFIYTITS
jgi:hypothetical protein